MPRILRFVWRFIGKPGIAFASLVQGVAVLLRFPANIETVNPLLESFYTEPVRIFAVLVCFLFPLWLYWPAILALRTRSEKRPALEETNSSSTAPAWIPVCEAIDYLMDESALGQGMTPTSHADGWFKLGEVGNIIREAGLRGDVTIRGKREINRYMPWERFDSIFSDIPPDYWKDMELDLRTCRHLDDRDKPQTQVLDALQGNLSSEALPKYSDLHLSRNALEKQWPRPKLDG